MRAQTISISNLQYPSTIVVNKQLTVSLTISYSGGSLSDYLATGIIISPQRSPAAGYIVSSNPDSCQQMTAAYPNQALCYFQLTSTEGSENVVFSLSNTSTGTDSFIARAILARYSTSCSTSYNLCIDADAGDQPFSVLVIDKFTLTVDTPSQVPVTLDGVQQGAGSFAMQLSPGMHAISVPNTVQLDSTSRLEFNSWSDGSTQLTRTFDLENDNEISAIYVKQYRLTLLTSEGIATGDEWTNSGSTAKFTVPATIPMNGTLGMLGGKYDFQGWYEGNSLFTTHNNGSITMNSPNTLTAKWTTDYTQPALIIVIIIALVAVALVVSRKAALPRLKASKRPRKRTRRTKPKAETTSEVEQVSVTPSTETAEGPTEPVVAPSESVVAPPNPIMYCSQCGAVISRDSKFCKECGAKL